MLALTFKVIGNEQMAVFAVFGSFGALVLSNFGGTWRDKLIAHLALAVAGSVGVIVGTLVSGSVLLAVLITVPFAFCVYFAGVAGPNAAAGVTAALLAYVLPVAAAEPAAVLPSRLEGWWLAQAVSTVAVLVLSPKSPGDRLRQSAAALARVLAQHLQAAVTGTATEENLAATRAAKTDLLTLFDATPYRPIGLATADQALASLITLLEWCASLTAEAMDGHLDLSRMAPEDRDLLAESSAALRAIARLLETSGSADDVDDEATLQRLWQLRGISAAHLRGLAGDPEVVLRMADHAFHAQVIGLTAAAAAADALIATGRRDPEWIDAVRYRWIAAKAMQSDRSDVAQYLSTTQPRPPQRLPGARVAGTIAADAHVRSVWFRNSARGACALAIAVAVARLVDVEHAFWVVLGTLSVLRSSAGATNSTALRALVGTVVGFVIGAALMVGIGTSPAALWIALPLAVLIAAYSPGTAPFAVGQAAFTVVVIVLFNLLVPVGWQVGLVRLEDVAIGSAVSVVVGGLFWPRGASALVGDDLADAFRAGAANLRDATLQALGISPSRSDQSAATLAAGLRLDDAVRAYLTEQGSKRLAKQDLWTLTMSAVRLRLTSYSMGSLPDPAVSHASAPRHPVDGEVKDTLVRDSEELAGFYDTLAAQVGRPSRTEEVRPVVFPHMELAAFEPWQCTDGVAHYHTDALWVQDHLSHLESHAASLVGPASRLAAQRHRPWWR